MDFSNKPMDKYKTKSKSFSYHLFLSYKCYLVFSFLLQEYVYIHNHI